MKYKSCFECTWPISSTTKKIRKLRYILLPQSLSKVELFSRFWRPRTLYFMSISDFITSIAQSKMTVQYRSWAQNDRSKETFQTSPHWVMWYKYFCCNPRKTDFRQLYENRARRHYFGLRGPTSNNYYAESIWDRNLILVAIFIICNVLNLIFDS